jgi:hypothetical protein
VEAPNRIEPLTGSLVRTIMSISGTCSPVAPQTAPSQLAIVEQFFGDPIHHFLDGFHFSFSEFFCFQESLPQLIFDSTKSPTLDSRFAVLRKHIIVCVFALLFLTMRSTSFGEGGAKL